MIHLSPQAAIPAHYANRHALITGPTGTGKTVTIMRLIESLAELGTPVICPDVKGDLPALANSCAARVLSPGQSLRVPLWAMGADLLARALELSDAQAGALEIACAWADDTGAPLDSLADMRALLAQIASAPDSVAPLGHVTRASIGTIQRALLRIERAGQGELFGAPGFDIASALEPGLVSILDASALYHAPRVYGAFMLWMLRELAQRFPEAGDLDRPRLAFVIDESHCLFYEASPALLRSIEATARLIRSKGVALVFASQSPDDLPHVIRAQCATRLEHAREHGVGNALFSTLDGRGNPTSPRLIRPELPKALASPARPIAAPIVPQAPHAPAQAPHEPAQAPHEPASLDAHGLAFLGALALLATGLAMALV